MLYIYILEMNNSNNDQIDLININSYLIMVNMTINISFYIYYLIRIFLKKCKKNNKHNNNNLTDNDDVQIKINELLNVKNTEYKKNGNIVNIQYLDEIIKSEPIEISKEDKNIFKKIQSNTDIIQDENNNINIKNE